MMDALISGEAGVALLLDGATLRSLHLDDIAEPVVRRQEELRLLFGDARDLQALESVTQDEVAARLKAAAARIDGLQLMLILLDPELTTDTRLTAAAEAEELFAQSGTVEAVESILYAEVLPADADPAGALALCSEGAPLAAHLVNQLVARQALIAEARNAWQEVPPAVIGTPEDCDYVQSVFVREGLFRSLVLLRETRRQVADFRLGALLNPEVKKLRNHREILRCWIEPFHQERELRQPEDQRVEAADVVAEGDAPPYRRGFDRQKRLANVESQKAAIVAAMEHGDLARARRYVAELIRFQTSGAQDPTFACMSLCDLAIKAKSLSLPYLQLELSQAATDLKPDDAWSWVQYADALLDTGSLEAALAATDNAIAFGKPVAGRGVRAAVLGALDRLDEALALYEEIIEDFQGDDVARTGRAGLLKTMNRLDEALAAYDEVIAAFPQQVFARTGRAEVLRSLNRLEEALTAYDEAIGSFPQNVVARSGRAEVLRSLNRPQEALSAYEDAIDAFPRSVVARNGRAEVLRSMNRHEEALAAYRETIEAFPQDEVARNGWAEVLRSLNRFDEALAAYDSTIMQFPHSIVARAGRAEVLRSLGRPGEALNAFDEILREHPYNLWSRIARAVVLASLGRLDEALMGLPDKLPVSEQDWVAYHVRGMVLLRRGNLNEATQIFLAGVRGRVSAEQRDYFRSALALTNLKCGKAPAAAEALNKVETRIIDPIANLLRLHAFCLLSQRDLAVEAEGKLAAVSEPGVQEVRSELRRRFLAGGQPLHSEPWILEQETVLLLAAVGTLLSIQRNRSAA
jgi:tetratricopeptide (TPR) repeat protein